MLVEKLIRRLKGNPNYQWESNYAPRDLAVIMWGRSRQALRGSWRSLFFKKHSGLAFIGTNVIIKHAYLLAAGQNLILEDNVYINALSDDGINIKNNVTLARNCSMICTGVIAQKGKGISIGNNSGINAGVFLGGQGGIDIGDNVIIGPGTKIFSENHNYAATDINIKDQGVSRSSVSIGNNCWVGANVTILAGVNIGDGCVIAAGSVVTRSVAPNSVVAGIPGKKLKDRVPNENYDEIINLHIAV